MFGMYNMHIIIIITLLINIFSLYLFMIEYIIFESTFNLLKVY